jgi:hypothetical protein
MGNRIAAVLVGLVVTFPLERWAELKWYFALALGALAYLCVRYIERTPVHQRRDYLTCRFSRARRS